MTLFSDFDQNNLRRGYDDKCGNCPRVCFEGLGGLPGQAVCELNNVNSIDIYNKVNIDSI